MIGAVVGLLAVSNVMSNRVLPGWTGWTGWLYVPWNLAVAGGCLWLAHGHVTTHQLGLVQWRRGWRWGLALSAATAGVLVVGAALPGIRDAFRDGRVHDGVWALVYNTVLRIPFGTVVLEEVAFRSVLPALIAVRVGVLRACIAASVLFGLWHVLPALGLTTANDSVSSAFGRGPDGQVIAVVFAVAGTALAGLWFCWLRYRSASLLTTVLAHVASNSLSYAIAWVVRA
ncbi:MAG: CPBP family intramembrane glutamic endopeptidase [Ilumatobacteraceae bacterium]